MPDDRMSLPVAREAAMNMALEYQTERAVIETLQELYVRDNKRDTYRWGRDLPFKDVQRLIYQVTQRVVYGK